MNLLRKYLLTEESIFDIYSLEDFIDSLYILGFHRKEPTPIEESQHLCYRFVNPKFDVSMTKQSDLYKNLADKESSAMRHSKRINGNGVGLLQKLMRKKTCSELRISRREFAQLQLDFALNFQLDLSRKNDSVPDIIDFSMEQPEYMKKNEIAGYYGNVPIEALKKAFQNYFPIFQDPEDTTGSPEKPEISVDPPTVCEEVEVAPEPKKKKIKYTRKTRDDLKETEQALLFLQKEAMEQ